MVTLLIILMMACNLCVLFYLTREHNGERPKETDLQNDTVMRQEPSDIIGRSKFRMPEKMKTEKDIIRPEAATLMEAEAVDEKDVTFADEITGVPEHFPRQVPDEKLDDVFSDMRVSDVGAEYVEGADVDEEMPQAGGNSFDEIDRAARTVKNMRAKNGEILQAGKVFHELEGTEFYKMFRRNNTRYEARISEMVDTYLASVRSIPKKTKVKAAVAKDYKDFNIRDHV